MLFVKGFFGNAKMRYYNFTSADIPLEKGEFKYF